MDYFLRLFGSVTIESAVFVLAALFFLWKTYKKVEKYFSEKALAEKAKNTKMAEVMDQVNKYPLWHQQSLDIQKKFTQEIEGLRKGQQENNKRLEKMEEENRRSWKIQNQKSRKIQNQKSLTDPRTSRSQLPTTCSITTGNTTPTMTYYICATGIRAFQYGTHQTSW